MQELAVLLRKCLEKATRQKFSSIIFPVLGTGVGGFSPEDSARVLLQTVDAFYFTYPNSHLKHISVVIRKEDDEILKVPLKKF